MFVCVELQPSSALLCCQFTVCVLWCWLQWSCLKW